MILKKIDFISPEITLFYKGSLSHSSIISGIISLISCSIIICISIYYFLSLIYRERDCPKIANNHQYIEDAGIFPLNSSSFFHFISFNEEGNHSYYENFDFTNFNLIGLEIYFQAYENDKDLTKYNHWLYGYCNKEIDIKGIENIVTQNYFSKSACIRKYYDSSSHKYYEVGDKNFRWPKIAHGTFNPQHQFYTLIVIKCEQNILNNILDKGYTCKNDEEVEKIINKRGAIHFNFIDHYVDILKYKEPIKKYINKIENTIDKDNYSINNINLHPILISTQNGILFSHYENTKSYYYDRNDVYLKLIKDNIYMVYYLWLKNTENYYERIYKTITDVLSSIGGVSNAIIFIVSILNKVINQFAALKDIKSILNSSNLNFDEKDRQKKNIKLKNNSNINMENIETSSIKKNYEKTDISLRTNIEITDKKISLDKDEKKEKQINNSIRKTKDENIGQNSKIRDKYNNQKEELTFLKFLIYKISCGKKNYYLQYYENFREKIISVENLIQNSIKINNLLKLKDKIYEI